MKSIFCYLFFAVFFLVSPNKRIDVPIASFEEDLYSSKDFTEEDIFTDGCEGPAMDSKENLCAANFEENGTVAIIR